jgi:molecular chaperone HtpG
MEVNPQHPLVRKLKDVTDEQRFSDWAHILFDQALLGEGGQLDDPAAFVARLNDLLLTLGGDQPRIIMPS